MLYKLAFRNISRSRIYYGFYFFILVVFAMLLYGAIAVSDSLLATFEQTELKFGSLSIESVFNTMKLFIIGLSVLFSIYISRFFIKRRSDEMALYKLLGLNNTKIIKLVSIENSFLFSLAAVVGIIFGVFFSRLFQQVCINFMRVDITDAGMMLNISAVFNVLVMMIVLWGCSLIIPFIYIKTISIAKLFSKKAEASQIIKIPVFSIILFLITAIFLFFSVGPGYMVLTTTINSSLYILLVFFSSIICAFTLYKGFLFLVLALLRKFNIHLKTPTLLLSLKHIETDTRQIYKLLAVVSIVVGIMTPFGLLVKSVQTMSLNTLPKTSLEQFAYSTNDPVMDQYFIDAFSAERKFESYSLEYQKVSTPQGVFYLLDQENALKLSFMSNPKNGLNSSIFGDEDYVSIDAKINNLTNGQLLFIETIYTESVLPNSDIDMFNQFQQSSVFIQSDNMLPTLLQSTDAGFDELFKQNQLENKQFLEEFGLYAASYDGIDFMGFHQFVPLNIDATTYLRLLVASDQDFHEILSTYPSETLTMRLFTTNNSIISNQLLQDLNLAEEYFLNQQQPLATSIIDNMYTTSVSTIVSAGALYVLAILIYSLLFFVLIATTLFRSLENGEKGNREYKIASMMGVKKANILKGISLEAFMIMIFPFLVGFVISATIFLSMLSNLMKYETGESSAMKLADIASVGLPIFVAVIIIYFIVVRNNYKNVFRK